MAAAFNALAFSVALSRKCWADLDGALLQGGGFGFGGLDEFAGFFAGGGAQVVGGLGDGGRLG